MMYRKKDRSKQTQLQMLCIEDLVPENHMLREIEEAIDWSFIYDEVKGLYKEAEWGNPGIDPVVLFKIVFIQYLYGIRSMRQTIKDIEVNVAYRWFIGYDLTESIPHFSTFGKNYKRRFEGTDIFERIFRHILEEAVKCGFVDASAIYIDGTHIRANANKKKYVKEIVEAEAKRYQKELDEEIAHDRKEHGKKPLKDKKDDDDDENNGGGTGCSVESKEITKSTTDPECGVFHKGEHERQFAYIAGTALTGLLDGFNDFSAPVQNFIVIRQADHRDRRVNRLSALHCLNTLGSMKPRLGDDGERIAIRFADFIKGGSQIFFADLAGTFEFFILILHAVLLRVTESHRIDQRVSCKKRRERLAKTAETNETDFDTHVIFSL